MFRRIEDKASQEVIFEFEGEAISALSGESVAAALLAANKLIFRETPVTNSARGPFCMMGVCFDCLMVIDGEPNIQACQVAVRDGMSVERQNGAAMLSPDGSDTGETS